MSSITADGLVCACGWSCRRRDWTARAKASAIRQLPRRRRRHGSLENALAHRARQCARLGLRRHGRRDLRADLADGDQGIFAHRAGISLGASDRALHRHRRALFLAVAVRPARPAHAARRQYRAVLAVDAGRGVVADLYDFRHRPLALGFALNGEWSLGSMLVAETWPARLRGRVISMTRSTWCLGASLAGGITGLVAADFGWRVAVMVPGVIALLAIYVRATCPESPYWVRAQDRKRRISETLARGGTRLGRRQRLVRQGEIRRHPPGVSARRVARHAWSRCSWPAAAPAFSARSAAGCRSISRPRSTGRPPNTACSTCSGASPASSASASPAGSPTGSAAGSPS